MSHLHFVQPMPVIVSRCAPRPVMAPPPEVKLLSAPKPLLMLPAPQPPIALLPARVSYPTTTITVWRAYPDTNLTIWQWLHEHSAEAWGYFKEITIEDLPICVAHGRPFDRDTGICADCAAEQVTAAEYLADFNRRHPEYPGLVDRRPSAFSSHAHYDGEAMVADIQARIQARRN